jgi:hypothetical protein
MHSRVDTSYGAKQRRQGASVRDLAKATGVSPETIRHVKRIFGLWIEDAEYSTGSAIDRNQKNYGYLFPPWHNFPIIREFQEQ